MKLKDRLKSYSFWVSLSAALVIFVEAIGKAFNFDIPEEIINNIVMGFCGVLVVLGVVVKPTSTTSSETLTEENKTENNKTEN